MSASGLPLQLTVPTDPRFRPIVVNLATRLAESIGFAGSEAAAIGRELADRSAALLPANGAGTLEVTFELAGQAFCARARAGAAAFEVSRPLPAA